MTLTRFHRARWLAPVLLVLSCLVPVAARADEEPLAKLTTAVLDTSALRQGAKATAAIQLDIKAHYHAQSRTPSEEGLVKFDAAVEPHPGMTFGDPIFPKGKDESYKSAGGGKPTVLNVYTGHVIVRVPIEVKPDAPLGKTTIKGTLSCQICDNVGLCFPPEDYPFTIETEIVPAGAAVEQVNQKVFEQAASPTNGTAPAEGEAAQSDAATSAGPEQTFGGSLLGALGLAFVVGICFNAVPCVLPVLPLKAMGFYEVSQHNRARSLLFGAAFSLGVIASFAALGMLVVVWKSFAWGELFSNPWFAGRWSVILAVMALNMFGLFTVNLPSGMYSFSPRHDTYVGNFLFGILTAALSTPCTFGCSWRCSASPSPCRRPSG